MKPCLFIGEKPSRKAESMGWTWEDGRLCSKTLLEALAACGVPREQISFVNLFGTTTDSYEKGAATLARLEVLEALQKLGSVRLVAMGFKVSRALDKAAIPHTPIMHPAGRGRMRLRENYHAHIREALA